MLAPVTLRIQSWSQLSLQRLTLLWQLGRIGLSAMVALSALTGYLFAKGTETPAAFILFLAIGLLASGCSALNQWQEQDLDARMVRTRQRPLPAGKLSATAALTVAIVALCCGILLLLLMPSYQPLLLGLLAIIWYNGIYTPLKKRTPFAALPGAICGALPPLIGWTAAGAPLFADKSMILAGTLFLWQIPHSWLLLCHYRQDLQQSGLPNLFETIPTERLLRINHCWLSALGLCYLLFPLFGYIAHPFLSATFLAGLAAIGLGIVYETQKELTNVISKRLFHLTNLSMALLLVILLLDNTVC